jgi:hypothetical protein
VRDGGVSQTASRTVVKAGRTVTYKTTLRNLGNVPFDAVWLHLVATKPGTRRNPQANSDRPAKKVRVLRVRTTRGSCARYPKYYRGSFCAIGRLEPGQVAVVTATLRLNESITYWGSLDYQPGRGNPVSDAQPKNDNSYLATRVRR